MRLVVPRTERVGTERIGVERLHEPRGWMLRQPEMAGLRFSRRANEEALTHAICSNWVGERSAATTVEYLLLR